MPRKGVAVSQIILLVLGILVLAVVAYLLYTNFVTTGGTLSAEQCRAAATRACTACSIASAGSVSNCEVGSYLDATGKQCAYEGKILGIIDKGITTEETDLLTNAKKTIYNPTGTIACNNYVGGASSGGSSSGSCNNNAVCDAGEIAGSCADCVK